MIRGVSCDNIAGLCWYECMGYQIQVGAYGVRECVDTRRYRIDTGTYEYNIEVGYIRWKFGKPHSRYYILSEIEGSTRR